MSSRGSVVLRRVVGAQRVWVVEASSRYGDDPWQIVVVFEFDDDGLIAKETRDVAMGCLMKGNSDNYWDHPD